MTQGDTRKRILLVEDEAGHRELIRRAFAAAGNDFALTIVDTLGDARAYLQTQRPDIVFVDFRLPDGNGTDLLSEHLAYPVVMLTSQGNEQIAVEALKAGALDYLVKSAAVFVDMPAIARRALREWGHIVRRRRAEARLKESEERLRVIFEAASEGIVLVDHHERIVLVNQYIVDVFQFSRDDLIGQPLSTLIDDSSGSTPAEDPLRSTHKYGRRKDGTRFPIDVHLTPISVSGEPLTVCFVVDITERVQLEEQRMYARALEMDLEKEREIAELKERFLFTVSHEFRTPLAIMMSSIEMIKRYFDHLPREKVLEKLDQVSAHISALVELIDEMLLLSKGNAQKVVLQPQTINLRDFCASMLDQLAQMDDIQHHFELETDMADPIITADRKVLDHVLTNIIANAIKYSPHGSTIRVRIADEPPSAGSHAHGIVISVRDKGIGIPPEDQPHVFKPFHRAANASNYDGTGLGLAIARQQIELHGGSISFESAVGAGTTFFVRLPRHFTPQR